MSDIPTRFGNGDHPALPFRLQARAALAPGWPPDVAPNQVIQSAHINSIRTSVAEWPGDVDGKTHTLRNVNIVNATGVMVDPMTTAGDLIARGASAPSRVPIGTQGQYLMADLALPNKVRWSTPVGSVTSVFGRVGAILANTGDYNAAQVTNAVSILGSYANPAWITQLAYSKLIGLPATFPPGPHQHDAADVTTGRFGTARLGTGIADETVYLRGDGAWAPVAGGSGGGGSVTSVFGRAGAVVAQTGDYSAAMVSGAVVNPTVALGDLMVRGSAGIIRLPMGANGQVLQSDATQPAGMKWINIGGGVAIPSGLSDGDILQWKSGAWAVLPVGGAGQVLTVDTAPGLKWGVGTGGGSQTPWLQDVDAGNHALTNLSALVATGAIRSVVGGFIFPDGTSMTTAMLQTPWVQDIDAGSFALSNVGTISASGDVVLRTGATERLRIFAAGNARFAGSVELGGISQALCGNVTYDGSNWRYIANGSAFTLRADAGQSVLWTAANGTAGAVASVSPRLTWRDDGYTILAGSLGVNGGVSTLGSMEIGGLAAGDRLVFIDMCGDDTYSDYGLRIMRNAGANGISEITHRGVGAMRMTTVETADIVFQTAGVERVRILGSGSTGIVAGWPYALNANASGVTNYTGMYLNRSYAAIGQTMDIVFGTEGSGNRTGRIACGAVGGGEAGFMFYAQTGAGDGWGNTIMQVNGNGQVIFPRLPSSSPSRGLWYDPADGNRVKYVP